MKRLMCLSLLLCLGAGLFTARGFADDNLVIYDVGSSSYVDTDGLGDASAITAAKGSWTGAAAGGPQKSGFSISTTDAALSSSKLGIANQIGIAIGSAVGNDGSASAVFDLKDLKVVGTTSGGTNAWTNLAIGGMTDSATGTSLSDFAVSGAAFSAKFGTVLSQNDGANLGLNVLVGLNARSVSIADLTAKTAAVQGDLATGNALELAKLTLVGSGSGVSSKAIDGDSTLTLGNVVWTGTAGDDVGFTIESSGANVGKIVFSDDFTFGRNEETITFVSDSGTGNARAEIVANRSLTLDNFRTTTADSAGVIITTSSGKGKISVGENLTINLAGAATLANVDVDAKGAATIGHKDPAEDTAAALTLGDTFTANGVTINGSSDADGVLTVNVNSLKSGLATLDDPATAGVDEAAFTANTITLNGNTSGVVLTGAGAATSKVDASIVRVLGGTNTNKNGITSLDVRSDLVVGTADAPAYLTVTTSNLRNLTQGRGATTLDGNTKVSGLTTIYGVSGEAGQTATVTAGDGTHFESGVTVGSYGTLTAGTAGNAIILGRTGDGAAEAVTGVLTLQDGGTLAGLTGAGLVIKGADQANTLASLAVTGKGNQITTGLVDASVLDLTMEFQKTL